MTAQLGDRALGPGDRVRLVTETSPLAARYGTGTVLVRERLGRAGRAYWCQVEVDTGGGPDGTDAHEEWVQENQLALVRRAGERLAVGRRGSA